MVPTFLADPDARALYTQLGLVTARDAGVITGVMMELAARASHNNQHELADALSVALAVCDKLPRRAAAA
jgi:hypothetical protein